EHTPAGPAMMDISDGLKGMGIVHKQAVVDGTTPTGQGLASALNHDTQTASILAHTAGDASPTHTGGHVFTEALNTGGNVFTNSVAHAVANATQAVADATGEASPAHTTGGNVFTDTLAHASTISTVPLSSSPLSSFGVLPVGSSVHDAVPTN